jgi:hypothetical protein
MGNRFMEATEMAIAKLVADFQSYPNRFWNERDLHWSLFYYLERREIAQEEYTTQLIRAEFPTLKKFGTKSPARGHYDLVILESESYFTPVVQKMEANDPWDDFLKLIKLAVAVEIKLWMARLRLETLEKRVEWDIRKLTEPPSNILNAFFLNFVQLDFRQGHNQEYYEKLRDYLTSQKRLRPELRILCVPSDVRIQPQPARNWI